jgi:predicted Zn-dependent protease
MKNRMRGVISLVWIVLVCWTGLVKAQEAQLLVLSEIEERIAGELAFVSLERELTDQGHVVTTDPAISAIGRAVAKYSDRPHLHYSFHVIEGDLPPRAFSLPGGYVCLSRSLIEQVCQTDADIAFVLGHEIAHSALRHYADYKLRDEQQVAYVKELLQQHNLFDPGTASSSADALHQVLLPYMAKIRQIKELEADQFGVLYALRAGYPFAGGLQVLQTLRRLYGEHFQFEQHGSLQSPDDAPEASVYPTLSERIEQLEFFRLKAVEVARLFPTGREALDRGDYREASLLFETIISLFPQSRAARIGLGVASHLQYWDSAPGDDFLLAYPGALELDYMFLLERGPRDFDALQRAVDEYRTVLESEPGNAYASNNLGVALAELNRPAEAEATLREALRLANRDFTMFNLALLLYQKLLDTQQREVKEEALALLKDYLESMPEDEVARDYFEQLESALP